MLKRFFKKIKKVFKRIKKFVMKLWPLSLLKKKSEKNKDELAKKKKEKKPSDDDNVVSIFDSYDYDDSYDESDDGESDDYDDDESDEVDDEDLGDEDADESSVDMDTNIDLLEPEEITDRLIKLSRDSKEKQKVTSNKPINTPAKPQPIKKIVTNPAVQKKLTAAEVVKVGDSGIIKSEEPKKAVINAKYNTPKYSHPIVKLSDEHAAVWYKTARVDQHSPIGPQEEYSEKDIKMFITYNKSLYLEPSKSLEMNITADKIYMDEFGPVPYFPKRETEDPLNHYKSIVCHPGSMTDFASTCIRIDRVNEAIMLNALYPDKYPKVLNITEVRGDNQPTFVVRPENLTYNSILEKYNKSFN